MRNIDMLPGGSADLADLRAKDPKAAADLVVFFQEADGDPRIIEKFTTHGDVTIGKDHSANIVGWVEARCGGDNLFRLKLLDPPHLKYRVIYGFDWHTRRIGILAIVRRKGDTYEIDSDLTRRILGDWRTATGGHAT